MQEVDTGKKTQSFRKSLGLFELVSLGVGGTIGSGIFIAPGVAASISGPASLLAWLIVAISASCVPYFACSDFITIQRDKEFFWPFLGNFRRTLSNTHHTPLSHYPAAFGVATIAAGLASTLYTSVFNRFSPSRSR